MVSKHWGWLLVLSAVWATSGWAEEGISVGLRAGLEATGGRTKDFRQYELFATYDLPWSWRWDTDWAVSTRLNAGLGILKRGADTGIIGSIGPDVILGKAGSPWSLVVGITLTCLSEDNIGNVDFGELIQFTSSLGLNYQLGKSVSVGYRFQHMSDAGIKEPNPGLNMHRIELGYHF